jgi:hypothetical protein
MFPCYNRVAHQFPVLHHLASAEIDYVVWLDAALPDQPLARYEETSRRFSEQVYQSLALPKNENITFFGGSPKTTVSVEHVVQEVLTAEHRLLNG